MSSYMRQWRKKKWKIQRDRKRFLFFVANSWPSWHRDYAKTSDWQRSWRTQSASRRSRAIGIRANVHVSLFFSVVLLSSYSYTVLRIT